MDSKGLACSNSWRLAIPFSSTVKTEVLRGSTLLLDVDGLALSFGFDGSWIVDGGSLPSALLKYIRKPLVDPCSFALEAIVTE